MKELLITALQIVLALAFAMLIYYVVPWLLGMLQLSVPDHIWKIIMVIVGLYAVIGALRGRWDVWKVGP